MAIRSVLFAFLSVLLTSQPAAAQDDGTTSASYDFSKGAVPGFPPSGTWTNVENWAPTVCLAEDSEGSCVEKGYPGQGAGVMYKVSLSLLPPQIGPATMALNVPVSLARITVDQSITLAAAATLGMNWIETDPDTGLSVGKTAIIENDGLIDVQSGLFSNTGVSIEGGGELRLGGGTISTPGGLTNSSTIRGAGLLTGAAWTNSGLIESNLPGNTLQVNVYASRNIGTLRATSGGILSIAKGGAGATGLDNTDGVIEATAGSVVELRASLLGGELQGAGTFRYFGTGSLDSIRNDANLDITAGSVAVINESAGGSIENYGQIELQTDPGVAAPTRLVMNGDVSLGGSGTLLLRGAKSQVTGQGLNPTLYIGSGNTVRGAGLIGTVDTTNTLSLIDNAGVIRANVAGDKLVLRAGGLDGVTDIANQGFMEATGGGTLEILNSDVTNTGQFKALAGSIVDFNGARVSGGVLDTDGTGLIKVRSSASLANLTNRGTLQVDYSDVVGTITNNGLIQLHYTPAAGSYAGLGIRGDVVLAGTGVLDLKANATDTNSARIRFAGSGGLLTNDTNHTIEGAGSIGYEGVVGVLNKGLIDANRAGPLTIFPQASKGGFSNQGTLRAGAGSTLMIWSDFNNYVGGTKTLSGGRYEMIAGTLRTPFGTDIVSNGAGILLDGPGSGFIAGTSGSTNALANFATNLASGAFEIRSGRNFSTAGSFANAGQLNIGAGSTFSVGGPGVFTQTSGKTVVDGTLQAITLFINGGSVGGKGTVQAGIANAGSLSPGNSPGVLTVLGDFTQGSTGVLEMELGGTLSGTGYDYLNVQGAFHAGGTLLVTLINGFDPVGGENFNLLDWSSQNGTFSAIDLPQLRAGLSWDTLQLYSDGVLGVAGSAVPLPGSLWGLLTGLAAIFAGRKREPKRVPF